MVVNCFMAVGGGAVFGGNDFGGGGRTKQMAAKFRRYCHVTVYISAAALCNFFGGTTLAEAVYNKNCG